MKKVVALIHSLYEDMELLYPVFRVREAKHAVVIAGENANTIYKGKNGYPYKSNIAFKDLKADDFDAMIIPGGFAPDKIRRSSDVLKCVREMHELQKPIAFICHGGWVAISAKILQGKRTTGTVAIKDDLENAGAIWVDASLVVDENLISSRTPVDLPEFGRAIVEALR